MERPRPRSPWRVDRRFPGERHLGALVIARAGDATRPELGFDFYFPGSSCRRCVERRGWRISSRFGTAHCTRMEREWAPALGPGDLPFALERAGRHGCCMLGRCQRRPARRERLRDARPVVSMRPGPDISTPRAPRASSAASLGPAPPPPRDTPVAAPGPARQPAPQRPGKCSGVSVLVKGPQHQRSSCRVGFSEKEKVMQQRMGLEKLGE